MTKVLTFNAAANTSSDLALISVVALTATPVYAVVDEYSDEAVARILRAKNAAAVPAPADADAFMSWLST